MGQTRAKKPKKEPKQAERGSAALQTQLGNLSLDSDSQHTTESKAQSAASDNSIQHQPDLTAHDPVFETDPTLIEVCSTEHKGSAIFANRKISAGTLILAEEPLLRLTQLQEDADKSGIGEDTESALASQFDVLSKLGQKSYLALFDSQKSGFSRIKSIYYSNCYNLSGNNRPSKSSPGGSCIGTLASRINHSCVPNVQFSFDEDRNLMLFHAIKAIPKGRELVSNYDSIYETRAQRQKRQVLYYGFKCDCEACEPGDNEFWSRSDERRRGIIEAKRALKDCEKQFEESAKLNLGMDPVGDLEKMEGLLIKEGLVGLPLADTYKSLSKWTDRLGDMKGAEKWRSKEAEVCGRCLGNEAVRTKEIRAKLN